MVRNIEKVSIRGTEYEIVANVGAMMAVERESGKSFMEVLAATEKGEFLPIVTLLGCCLKENGIPVGTDFIEELYFDEMETLLEPLMRAIENAFPKDDGKGKNVKPVQKKKA